MKKLNLCLSIVFIFLITPSFSQVGSLDKTFSSDGKQTTTIGSVADAIYDMALQSDGKIVAVGISVVGMYEKMAVVRYNADGTLDNNFSSDGKVVISIGSKSDYATSVAIQSDGKIIIVGYTESTQSDIVLVRLNADGSMDNTFSSDGKLTLDFSNKTDEAYSVAVQSDGKIVIGGVSGTDFCIARYTKDGTLDNTFSSDGKQTTAIGLEDSRGLALAVQADNKIVMSGSSSVEGDYAFSVVRYSSDGSLDKTFSADGIVITQISADDDEAIALALQADGKIVVTGYSSNNLALVRYNADGSLDTKFNSTGIVTDTLGDESAGQSVAIQADQKIVVGGYIDRGLGYDFMVMRFNTNGTKDVLKSILDFGTEDDDDATCMAIQPDGKILAGGVFRRQFCAGPIYWRQQWWHYRFFIFQSFYVDLPQPC